MPLPSTAAFKAAVVNAHTIRSRAVLMRGGVEDSSTTFMLTSGNVTEDTTNAVRGKCNITLIDPAGTLTPKYSYDALFPGYNEIKLYRGIYLPSGTLEEKSLGIFGFEDVNADDSGDSYSLQINGFDRSQRVSDSKFTTDTTFSGAIGPIIQSIVSARIPNATFNFTPTNYTVNQVIYKRGDDPWKACRDLATAAGMDIYFDRSGACTMVPFPTLNDSVDWVFEEGEEAVLLTVGKTLNRSEFNHWYEIAEGSNIAVPFYGEARDDADIAASGDRPYFHVSSLYTTQPQAQAAAQAMKAANSGATEKLQLMIVPNPAILTNDLCQVVNSRTRTDSRYIISKLITPLLATQGQNIATREQVA